MRHAASSPVAHSIFLRIILDLLCDERSLRRLETSTQLSSGYVPFDGDGFSCSDGSPGNAGVPKVYLADLTADEHKDIFVCAGFAQPRLFVRTSSASDWSVVTDSPLISEGPCLSAMIADINEVRS
eukprot:SAG31_NODE_105_length_25008_cov_17.439399_14_plen_126_part_00